jgi:hypothetical protein
MVSAASAKPGRAPGIEVYELPSQHVTHAELVVRGIEHGDTAYEVRIFFNAPEADGDTARTAQAGYAGHISISGHGHHTGPQPDHPRAPIDLTIDVTDAFHHAVETRGRVQWITLIPVADGTVTDTLWRYDDFELRTHEEPVHGAAHIVDEFGAVTD